MSTPLTPQENGPQHRSEPVSQSRDEDALSVATSSSGSPLTFFVLVFALSIPFWVLYAWTRLQLTPTIPVSALMVFCPFLAASILTYRQNGITGVRALLRRSFDYRRIKASLVRTHYSFHAERADPRIWIKAPDRGPTSHPPYPGSGGCRHVGRLFLCRSC